MTVGLNDVAFSVNFTAFEMVAVTQASVQRTADAATTINATAIAIAGEVEAIPATAIAPNLQSAVQAVASPLTATVNAVNVVVAQLAAIVRMQARWSGAGPTHA